MGTYLGAMVSIVVGILVNVLWRFIFRFEYDVLNDFHELFPAFTIAMLTYIIISLWSNKRQPDSQHLAMVSGKK